MNDLKKIALVDDDIDILESLGDLLTLKGFEVCLISESNEALKKLTEFNPDVIVCDIMMPGLNGFDVLRELQSHRFLNDKPFVFLSAKTATEDVFKGIDVGAKAYLRKPVELSTMLETLTKVWDNYQQHQKLLYGFYRSIGRLMSHELNTPLNGIMGASAVLKELVNTEDETVAEMISILQISTQRIINTKNKLFWYYKVMDMDDSPDWASEEEEDYLISGLLNEVIQKINLKYPDKQSDISVNLIEDSSTNIAKEALDFIIGELVENAVKHNDKNAKATLWTTEANNEILIGIRQNNTILKDIDVNMCRPNTAVKLNKDDSMYLGMCLVNQIVNKLKLKLVKEVNDDEGFSEIVISIQKQ